jgi:hypothetical protein
MIGFTGTSITITINYYNSQSILTAEVSLHSASCSTTDGQSVSQCVLVSSPMTRYLLLCGSYGLVLVGRPL